MSQDRVIEAFFDQSLELTREAVEAQADMYVPTLFDFFELPWRTGDTGLMVLDANGKGVCVVAGNDLGRCREVCDTVSMRVNAYPSLVSALRESRLELQTIPARGMTLKQVGKIQSALVTIDAALKELGEEL